MYSSCVSYQNHGDGLPKQGDTRHSDESPLDKDNVDQDKTSPVDEVTESWDRWMASRKNSPATEGVSDEVHATQRNTMRALRRDVSWAAREISNQEKGAKWSVGRRRWRIVLLRKMGRKEGAT